MSHSHEPPALQCNGWPGPPACSQCQSDRCFRAWVRLLLPIQPYPAIGHGHSDSGGSGPSTTAGGGDQPAAVLALQMGRSLHHVPGARQPWQQPGFWVNQAEEARHNNQAEEARLRLHLPSWTSWPLQRASTWFHPPASSSGQGHAAVKPRQRRACRANS